MGEFKGGISTITLAAGGQVYVQGWIDTVQLLRYKFISLELLQNVQDEDRITFSYFPYAEFVLHSSQAGLVTNADEAIARIVLRSTLFCLTLS
jgi:hypothetical protein